MKRNDKNIVEFMLIYNRHKTKVYNFTLQMLRDTDMTKDVVQNVFMKLFSNLNNIRNKSSIQSWIFKTTRNEIFTVYRKRKTRNEVNYDLNDEQFSVLEENQISEEYEKKELKELILKNLEQLPQEQKEVFLLKEYGQLSYREISGLLEIDEGLVKSRLYKTRQKLISQLSKVL
ncbi:MAG TPA: RNA polymerase sigma factor [Ignavibacteria bacterium]|nr:RNA polymerase sigma factor [Ignavibacteria bacterium]